MDATRRSDLADPEFEAVRAPALRLRDFEPRHSQRVIVNPFLAVLDLLVLGAMFVGRHWFGIFSVTFGVALIVLLPHLIQFHCLDCGRTGRYTAHKAHACPVVVKRWNDGLTTRFPSARAQLIVWGWVLASVGFLLGVVLSG